MAEELLRALGAGASLALRYSPVIAPAVAVVAAALAGFPKASHSRVAWAWGIVVIGWLAGDGLRVLARARDFADGIGALLGPPAPAWAEWTTLAVWAAASLLVAYALPAWAGAFVGRRVTRGTGWLSAIAVSLAASALVAAATRTAIAAG